LPILVGGTGLYIRTLLDGIAEIPPIDPEVRSAVRAASVAENYAALAPLDPCGAARLNPGDSTRVARALEVVRSTGRPLAFWHEQASGGIGEDVDLRPLLLLPPRDWLIARCDRRFAAMVDDGAVAEVAALAARRLDPALPVMRAIGVRELGALASGEWSKMQAIAAGQIATRRYAKRQYTWFANQPPAHWPRWSQPLDELAPALALLGASV
jgi:tRNA dimethylallyltransferase